MKYALGMTSNYAASEGDPEPALRRMAEAGYKYVLWGHHAWSDYIYTAAEVEHAARCLREHGLALADLHCPTGKEQRWGSPVEWQRLAGIELVKNRIAMAARLACGVVVCHVPTEPEGEPERTAYWDRQRRTMDALQPYAVERGVRIALENTLPGNFDTLERFFEMYGPEFLGLCYDSGHGAAKVDWPGNGLERLERVADRMIDLHLHDNDGTGDQHLPPFAGTVDWERLAEIIPTTSYTKPLVPLEVGLKPAGLEDEDEFLRQMAAVGKRFAGMVEAAIRRRQSGRAV